MTRHLLVVGLLVLAAAAPGTPAFAQDLPYPSFQLQQFPSVDWEVPGKAPTAMFPDYDAQVLTSSDYFEQPSSKGVSEGVLTVETSRDCLLSLIYYSPEGVAYLVRSSLPAPARSFITSTFKLPLDDKSGLTRLLLWDSGFDESWLPFLARHPQQDMEAVPGMLVEAWFGRQQSGPYRFPWEDQYRPVTTFRTDYVIAADPYCVARLNSEGRATTKDCAVEGNAPVRLATDEYGVLGMWELDWSSRLKLEFEFPPHGVPSDAYLVVYGSSGQAFGVAANPAIEVQVNGWLVAPSLHVSPFEVSAQPIALDVSQYLEEGNNQISLQLSALADKIWKVSRIELWTD